MAIVQVEDATPLLLKPSVAADGSIALEVYDPAPPGYVNVPLGDSVRDYCAPPSGLVEARVLDDGATVFTVTDVGGSPWSRPAGANYCNKRFTVPAADNDENTYAVTIATTGAATRNQTIIIKRKPL